MQKKQYSTNRPRVWNIFKNLNVYLPQNSTIPLLQISLQFIEFDIMESFCIYSFSFDCFYSLFWDSFLTLRVTIVHSFLLKSLILYIFYRFIHVLMYHSCSYIKPLIDIELFPDVGFYK